MGEPTMFRVKADTDIHKLGGCIKKAFINKESFEITAMGAGAVNQAVKAMAVANSYLAVEGKEMIFYVPGFKDTIVKTDLNPQGEKKSFICFTPKV